MRVYASKDGVSDSIKTIYKYTSGKVKNVEATPNGGAVMKNTEVTLKCATEGATILYSTDDGQNWTEYTEKIVLSELPMTFKVKAVKEGYEDSNIVTLSYTERTSEKYNLYFGQLHSSLIEPSKIDALSALSNEFEWSVSARKSRFSTPEACSYACCAVPAPSE